MLIYKNTCTQVSIHVYKHAYTYTNKPIHRPAHIKLVLNN